MKLKLSFLLASLLFLISCSDSEQSPNYDPTLFDLSTVPHYDQVDHWLAPQDTVQTPLMSADAQAKHYQRFLAKWTAPWDEQAMLQAFAEEDFYAIVSQFIERFQQETMDSVECATSGNCFATALKTNFRHYTPTWLAPLSHNMNVAQFEQLPYALDKRAIVTQNSMVRVLPTHDVYYRRHLESGNVIFFDRLQTSVIWAGTPVYILGTTRDQAWHYVFTTSYSGWLPAETVSLVDEAFIAQWQSEPLMALMQNDVTLINDANQQYMAQVGIGAVFPGIKDANSDSITLAFPLRDTQGQAQIARATLHNTRSTQILPMPVSADLNHFAILLNDMIDQPYGWGGIHFYNDCSQELKNIYTPFGIWLQRHSRFQVEGLYLDDLDELTDEQARIDFVREHARPLMTIAYIGGHTMMYVGEDADNIPVFYQNIWGMREKNTNSGHIIGQSLFLPIDVQAACLHSLADPDVRSHFWLGHLDQPVWD